MDSQPLPDPLSDHILFVTIKGEEALQTQRFMMCVQGNDSIAQVRETLQLALRELPGIPQGARVATIEFEHDGADYVVIEPIRVKQIFKTYIGNLKAKVDIQQVSDIPLSVTHSAGGQRPTDQEIGPIKAIEGSPARLPLSVLRNSGSPLKNSSVPETVSDDDVEMIGSSNPVTRTVVVASPLKNHAASPLKSKGCSPICRSLFSTEKYREAAESPPRTDVRVPYGQPQEASPPLPDLHFVRSPLGNAAGNCKSPRPSPTNGAGRDACNVDDGTSVPDDSQLAAAENMVRLGDPSLNTLEEAPQRGVEQGNQETCATSDEQEAPHIGEPHSNGFEGRPGGDSLLEEMQQPEIDEENHCNGGPPQRQEALQSNSLPIRSPQKIRWESAMGEKQPALVKPTRSEDTFASCETASKPYKKPSKRKSVTEYSQSHGSFGNGGHQSPMNWRKAVRPDCTSAAVHSVPSPGDELGDVSLINGSDQAWEKGLEVQSDVRLGSLVVAAEDADTTMVVESRRLENGDTKRKKKKRLKQKKQGREGEQPAGIEEPEGPITPFMEASLSEQVGGSNEIENGGLTGEHAKEVEPSPQTPKGKETASEHASKRTHPPVQEEVNGVGNAEQTRKESNPKKKRRLAKKHSNHPSDDGEAFVLGETPSPRAVDVDGKGPKSVFAMVAEEHMPSSTDRVGVDGEGPKSLFAIVAEEHMPSSTHRQAVHRQDDIAGGEPDLQQEHVPETAQEGRLQTVPTPVRSSPRKRKAVGSQVVAAQGNNENQSADPLNQDTTAEENATRRKKKKGSEGNKKRKKAEKDRSRLPGSHKNDTAAAIELSDSHDYSPNASLQDVDGEDELSDAAKRTVSRRSRNTREKSAADGKVGTDHDAPREPCMYMPLGCEKTYQYKTSAYYLHTRSCPYKGEIPV